MTWRREPRLPEEEINHDDIVRRRVEEILKKIVAWTQEI
jgi:hypothetical protein